MTTAAAAAPCAASSCDRTLRDYELVGRQTICTPCVSAIRRWLREIPNQMIVLGGSVQRETTGAVGGRGTRTPPLPGREDVLNLIGPAATDSVHDEHGDQHGELPIVGVLGAWVRLICEERHWRGPDTVTPEALALWLSASQPLGWACRQAWAGEYRDELWALTRTIRSTTRVRPQRRPIPQPCPRCDSLTLAETDWEAYIDCGTCESRFTRDELALAARIATAELGAA
ncbi:hypothetical protein [Streptomyces sp. NPDC057413]|uniref:hypothetical protein n=1 Tax=Streptomyces sp. NPDC057413 TaxID=3346124 RepID=UPI0036AC670A